MVMEINIQLKKGKGKKREKMLILKVYLALPKATEKAPGWEGGGSGGREGGRGLGTASREQNVHFSKGGENPLL